MKLSTTKKETKNYHVSFFLFLIISSFSWLIFPIVKSQNSKLLFFLSQKPFSIALIFSFLVWLLIIYIFWYQDFQHSKVTKTLLLSASVVSVVLPFIILPIESSDLYNYITRGRIISIFGENPYYTPYTHVNDPGFAHLINKWSYNTTAYGGLFSYISALLSYIGKKSSLVSIFTFKSFFLIVHFINIFLVEKISNSKLSVFLYALNPIIIFEFVNNVHLDSLNVFFVLSTIYFLKLKGRFFYPAILSVILSVYVKYFTAIFIPFVLVYIFSQTQKSNWPKIIAFTLLVSALSYLAFFQTFGGLATVIQRPVYILRLVTQSSSVVIKTSSYLRRSLSGASLVLALLPHIVFAISYAVTLFLYIKGYINKKRVASNHKTSTDNLVKYLGISYFILLNTLLSWVLPWYYVLLLTFAIVYYGLREGRIAMFFVFSISFLVACLDLLR
jgi:uncharacterized protein with PQ loop repeat